MLDFDTLRDNIINAWWEGMDLKDLYDFYYDIQEQYLGEISQEELLQIAKDYGLLEEED